MRAACAVTDWPLQTNPRSQRIGPRPPPGPAPPAGLDVFEDEPAMKPGLEECQNAVIVPHIASATLWTRAGMVGAVCACLGRACCPLACAA